jgi:hypothetical protein
MKTVDDSVGFEVELKKIIFESGICIKWKDSSMGEIKVFEEDAKKKPS